MNRMKLLFLLLFAGIYTVHAAEMKVKINKRYLNLPVSQTENRATMSFYVDGEQEREFVIRLSENPEYWVFSDMSAYKGKTVTIKYNGTQAAMNKIYQDDRVNGAEMMYKEKNRPQLHFTPRRGWMNDPNGLVFYDGEYHLFFQHNPYEREWENMHWGHAVSNDLVHWEELQEALYPDKNGTAFSGSAIIDYNNVSGFGTKNNPAMVAFYTGASSEKQVQCVAYSLDKGRTWKKYDGNPVIDSKHVWNSQDTRDPKVFLHEPSKTWVMVLNERDGHSIYNSGDLKNWSYQSHVAGFWECPELFQLPIDGDKNNTMWVMYGASGTYMLGDFDGKKFTPRHGKFTYGNGKVYAAQTFTNIPTSDGRRIQIGWQRTENPGMPFKSQMSVPSELTLRSTPNGPRLYSSPVKEVDMLQGAVERIGTALTSAEANKLLAKYNNIDQLRIKGSMKLSHATDAGFNLYGQRIINYDLNSTQLNEEFYSPHDMTSTELFFDMIVDRNTVEVFVDGGAFSYCLQREPRADNNEGYHFWGNKITVNNLEVYPMASIWNK